MRDGGNSLNMSSKKSSKSSPSHKCNGCYKLGYETDLKTCGRCKAVKYCSKECQASDWQTHKTLCNKNALQAEALQSALNPFNLIPLPEGLTLSQIDQRLAKWIKFHTFTLMGAGVNAISIATDLTRAKTHVLQIMLSYRSPQEHRGRASKFFRVADAKVVTVAEAMSFPAPWPESLQDLARICEENEKLDRGPIAGVGIECPPLGVQFVPLASLKGARGVPVVTRWKEILIVNVEKGERSPQF